MTTKRVVFLDYLRIFACFLVILVHASENYYGTDGSASDIAGPQSFLANDVDRLCVSVYDGFSRISVPLFMMVSAFLLLPIRKGQTSWQFYSRRLKRVVPPVAFFMILYSTLPLLWGGIDGATSVKDLSRFFLNFPTLAGHFWYIYPLIGIYLFMPIISPWLERASRREEQFFIGLFLLSTCMPYLNRWFGEVWGQCFWNEYHMLWNFAGYIGYVVLAHYIRFYIIPEWSRSKRLCVGLIATIVGAAITIYSFYIQAIPGIVHSTSVIELGWAFCTINCVLFTFGAFLVFTCIERGSVPGLIADMSQMSFGVYLVHLFWLGLFVLIFKTDMALPTVAAIPVISLATFLGSYLTIKIVSYLPGSRWLIG
ncbi:MAG: acyltransferase family protein [Alistipes sp.]|nr:acyltransferase family protein [Alistipes sp.]